MEDREILQKYIELVPFLNKILGEGTEIALHDVTHPNRSLIAIANPLSGRELGSPMTELAKDIVDQSFHTKEDFIANYNGSAKGVNFLSSTYFIKNEDRLIGLLCINRSTSSAVDLFNALHHFLTTNNLSSPEQSDYHENLDTKVEDFVESRIAQTISLSGFTSERLKPKEKIQIVQRLNDLGILKIKGAVEEASKQLGVSIPTIYRYLKK